MNQSNTIKGMIPQRLLDFVPANIRDRWAGRIVELFRERNPELYAAMGQWPLVPEEEVDGVVKEILRAAETVHREIMDSHENQ